MLHRRRSDTPLLARPLRIGQEVREKLGQVAVSSAREDAIALEEGPLDAPATGEGRTSGVQTGVDGERRVRQQFLLHQGQGVLAANRHGENPGQVVDPRDLELDLLRGGPEEFGDLAADAVDLVAETDGLDGGVLGDRPGQGGHRVGEVEQPGIWADTLHRPGQFEHDGDVAEGAGHAARADRVTDRLDDAVAGGDLDIVAHRLQAAGRDRHDDEVGIAQGGLLVGFDLNREIGPSLGDDAFAQVTHDRRCIRVDVVEDDRAGEAGGEGDILEEDRGPVVAAAADDADPDTGHGVLGSLGEGGHSLRNRRRLGGRRPGVARG